MSINHMNTKIIEIKDRSFTLIYLNETSDFSTLKNELDIVSVKYFPKPNESVKDCKKAFQDCTPEIFEVVKMVVETNKNFFQYFDVDMKFIANRIHYYEESLIDYTFYLDTRLKSTRN